MIRRRQATWILALAVFSGLALLDGHKVLVLGKNGDGVIYASLARNLAEGYGSFWAPYLSDTNWPVHHEHPPLVYGIQSLVFRVFGDSPYVEGVYGFGIALVALWLTARIWRLIRRDFGLEPVGGWWPALLLLALPDFSYFMQSNRLAVTFLVFALLSVFLSYRSVVTSRHGLLYALLSGIVVFGGLLAKGPVAFFAWSVPAIAWLTLRVPAARAIAATLVSAGAAVAGICVMTALSSRSTEFWYDFLGRQVIPSLLGRRGVETYTYYWRALAGQLVVAAAVIAALSALARVSPRRLGWNRQATFCLLVALAGCLPFFVSPRQRLRYIIHTFPFFVLALSFLSASVAATIEEFMQRRGRLRLVTGIAALLAILVSAGAMLCRKDAATRAHAYFEDIYLRDVADKTGPPARSTVAVYPVELIGSEFLFAFLQRYQKLSVTGEPGQDYIIVEKNRGFSPPAGYEQVLREPTKRFLLYRRMAHRAGSRSTASMPAK